MNTRIGNLIKLVQGKLKKPDRGKIIALITLDVHGREVVERLIADKCEGPEAFAWQQQLRFCSYMVSLWLWLPSTVKKMWTGKHHQPSPHGAGILWALGGGSSGNLMVGRNQASSFANRLDNAKFSHRILQTKIGHATDRQ